MADDRMKKDDDLQRNMGAGARDQDYGQGQQSPGRSGQGGQQGGQHAGGYGGSQPKTNKHDMEDDDLGAGGAQTGGQGRGNQNR